MDGWTLVRNRVHTEFFKTHQTLSSANIPTARTMATKTFHPFPKLPLELREMIWERTFLPASPVAQNSRLNTTYASNAGPGPDIQRSSNPVALQVNRGSRAVAMRFYQKRRALTIPGHHLSILRLTKSVSRWTLCTTARGPGVDPYMELIH